jgi:surfactin synthase thioesterase subunit
MAMTGEEEDITQEELAGWQKETVKEMETRRFAGKHFFIFNYSREVMQLINARLVNGS